MLEKASEYLGTDLSYAQTVQHQGMPIMHDDRTPAGLEKASGLAASTVWRWLSWLGGMPGALRAALRLIRQQEPNSTFHRQPWAVSPAKYRSQQRREVLQQAMQLLAADRVIERMLGTGIFPRYAINPGGP